MMEVRHVYGALTVWTVYRNTRDYPGYYVLRPHYVRAGGHIEVGPAIVAESLEEIRRSVPEGCMRLDRHPKDDPVIVETWI